MGEDTNEVAKKRVVLLDLSMFALDLLSPDSFSRNFTSDEVAFEVPSALVTMIWAAKADEDSGGNSGRKLLLDFISAHLRGIQNSPEHKKSRDPRTAQLLNSIQTNFDSFLVIAYQRIVDEFAPLIQGGSKLASDERPKTQNEYPIKQYEPVLAITESEQITLRYSYKIELGLDGQPLYDLYFQQVHHAQSQGIAASPVLRRKVLAIGRITHNTIRDWKKNVFEAWKEQEYEQEDEALAKDVVEKYTKVNWKPFLLAFGLDLTLSYLIPGSGIVLNVANAFISTAAPIVVEDVEKKTGLPLTDMILGIMVIIGLISVCVFAIGWAIRYFSSSNNRFQPLNPQISEAPVTAQVAPTLTLAPDLSSFPTSTATFQPYVVETITTSIISTPQQTISNSPNYCLYVIQPNDTLQSVAAWFSVTENDIRNSDSLVGQGVFTLHQLVNVNAPCCTRIGTINGRSYFVQPKDNVFRLAINFSTSVEAIVFANNLGDSRYIQTGQMLCIPHP